MIRGEDPLTTISDPVKSHVDHHVAVNFKKMLNK